MTDANRQALLDQALAVKAAMRRDARIACWPEKIKTIERLRDATQLAREAMRARLDPMKDRK